MSHEISIVNGQIEAVFGYGESPWWDSSDMPATIVPGAISFDDIFTIAFPWEALLEPLYYPDGKKSSVIGIRRSDTHYELGIHSPNYGNIQPRDLFDFCASFFKEHPEVPISSAISLMGGKVLNLSAKIGEYDVLNSGDKHNWYICFANGYANFKAQAYMSDIQPVCWNTTRIGLQTSDTKVGFKHTKYVKERLEAATFRASELMQNSQASLDKIKSIMEELAKRKPTRQAYEEILDQLFGDSESTRTKNVKSEVTNIVMNGVNAVAYPDFRGTGYGIYSALTDYSDHYTTVRQVGSREGISDAQVRFESGLIGKGSEFKTKALEVLQKVLVLSDGSTEVETSYYDMGSNQVINSEPSRKDFEATEIVVSPGTLTADDSVSELILEGNTGYSEAMQPEQSEQEPEWVGFLTNAPDHLDCSIAQFLKYQGKGKSKYRLVRIPVQGYEYQKSIYEKEGYKVLAEE